MRARELTNKRSLFRCVVCREVGIDDGPRPPLAVYAGGRYPVHAHCRGLFFRLARWEGKTTWKVGVE